MPLGTVLITGAGGFIGSHLVEAAVAQGWRVRAFTHYNSRGLNGWLDTSARRTDIDVFSGDIRDFDSVVAAVRGCDSVFHLAALIGIPYSYTSPLAYVKTNIEGTYNVLEAARQHEVGNVIVTSTSETYGTAQYVPIDEAHPAVAQSPYAATKLAADQLALSYWRSFRVPVKIVRPFNTYGPRQSARAIIPTIISQILGGRRTLTLGSLDPTRDLTFVADTVKAFLAVAGCAECVGTAVNVGTHSEISVKRLVDTISGIMGVQVDVETDPQRVRPSESEVMRLVCDHSKLAELTGWRAQFDLESGLERTVAWFRQNATVETDVAYRV